MKQLLDASDVLLLPAAASHLCGRLHVALDALGLVVHCVSHAAADSHAALLGLQGLQEMFAGKSECDSKADQFGC
jgi:hypothetical protein